MQRHLRARWSAGYISVTVILVLMLISSPAAVDVPLSVPVASMEPLHLMEPPTVTLVMIPMATERWITLLVGCSGVDLARQVAPITDASLIRRENPMTV